MAHTAMLLYSISSHGRSYHTKKLARLASVSSAPHGAHRRCTFVAATRWGSTAAGYQQQQR